MDSILDMLRMLPGIVIAFSFHEWGHAFAAYLMGDPTARNLGRMTLNPLAHIDPMGFLMMIIAGFGWAKPVPVNSNNYRNYRVGELVVSLAGVTMNLILAVLGIVALAAIAKANRFFHTDGYAGVMTLFYLKGGTLYNVGYMLAGFITFNFALMVFNLLPVFPLDGFHVAEVTLAKLTGPKPFMFLRNYGQYILIGILLLGRFGFSFIGPVVEWFFSWFWKLAQLAFGITASSVL